MEAIPIAGGDVVIAPDNRTIYFVTDVQGRRTTDAKGASTTTSAEPEAILEFKYAGSR